MGVDGGNSCVRSRMLRGLRMGATREPSPPARETNVPVGQGSIMQQQHNWTTQWDPTVANTGNQLAANFRRPDAWNNTPFDHEGHRAACPE